MATITINKKKTARLHQQLDHLGKYAASDFVNVLKKAAFTIEADAKKSIQRGSKTGNFYGSHQASAPGESPSSDSGRLASSINSDVDALTLTATIGTSLDYGTYLEFGTKDIEPRPWLTPAYQSTKNDFIDELKRTLNFAMRKASKQR